MTCSVSSCFEDVAYDGLCQTHYEEMAEIRRKANIISSQLSGPGSFSQVMSPMEFIKRMLPLMECEYQNFTGSLFNEELPEFTVCGEPAVQATIQMTGKVVFLCENHRC